MSVAVTVTALVVIGLLATTLLVALWIFTRATDTFHNALDRAHERWNVQTSNLLDRLMAKDWQEYAEISAFDPQEAGGFLTPEEQTATTASLAAIENDEITQMLPNRFSATYRNAVVTQTDEITESLLAEDFDEEGTPR